MVSTQRTPKAIEDCHELLLWILPQLDQFPRNRRFSLGEKLETRLLSVLELLVSAAYTRNKKALLEKANTELEVVRHLWRLCHELQVINTRRYEHASRLMHDLGRQLGGWVKSTG